MKDNICPVISTPDKIISCKGKDCHWCITYYAGTKDESECCIKLLTGNIIENLISKI